MDTQPDEDQGVILHVLDLPQLYTCPSAQVLLQTLELLAIRPRTLSGADDARPNAGKKCRDGTSISEDGLPKYLTSIIGSKLVWIKDEAGREKIWEASSKRISERAGRSALPSMTRNFLIPTTTSPTGPSISITLCEPSLTEDNLGHKTWLASFLLAKRLAHLPSYFPSIPSSTSNSNHDNNPTSKNKRHDTTSPPKTAYAEERSSLTRTNLRILELGSGTGLVGIAAASIFPSASVLLTDLPAIIPNLSANVTLNREIVMHAHPPCARSTMAVQVLDWSCNESVSAQVPPMKTAKVENTREEEDGEVEAEDGGIGDDNDNDNDNDVLKFDLILVADPLYSPEHPAWLAHTICRFLSSRNDGALVVVEVPLREAYRTEVETFKGLMDEGGLGMVEHGEEGGFDDWGDGEGDGKERREVRCWWGVWRWKDEGKVEVEK